MGALPPALLAMRWIVTLLSSSKPLMFALLEKPSKVIVLSSGSTSLHSLTSILYTTV